MPRPSPPQPPQKGHSHYPNFRPTSVVRKRLDELRCHGTEVGLGGSDIVLDGDPDPLPKRGTARNFWPMSVMVKQLYMDQDGTWHGSGPRFRPHCARWGPSSPPKKGHSPQFSAHVYCSWMHQNATWYGGRPRSRPHCAAPPKGAQSPNVRPMSVVAKRLDALGYHLVRLQASTYATLC